MNLTKIKKLYENRDVRESDVDGWLLTNKNGHFTLWCDLFHKKYHEFKDNGKFYRKHRCLKCGDVYIAPNITNIDIWEEWKKAHKK